MTFRAPPSTCPVCGDALHTTRLSCEGCDTELTGHFARCAYCALGADDREILALFLGSRGNVKEVERALGVSYPTARARVDAVLERLGFLKPPPARSERLEVLERLARGEIGVDDALEEL